MESNYPLEFSEGELEKVFYYSEHPETLSEKTLVKNGLCERGKSSTILNFSCLPLVILGTGCSAVPTFIIV